MVIITKHKIVQIKAKKKLLGKKLTSLSKKNSFPCFRVVLFKLHKYYLAEFQGKSSFYDPDDDADVLHLCKTDFFASRQMVRLSDAQTFCAMYSGELFPKQDISQERMATLRAMECDWSLFKDADEGKVNTYLKSTAVV